MLFLMLFCRERKTMLQRDLETGPNSGSWRVAGLGCESKLPTPRAHSKYRAVLPGTQPCGMPMDLRSESSVQLRSAFNHFCVLRVLLPLCEPMSSFPKVEIKSLLCLPHGDLWVSTLYKLFQKNYTNENC